MTCFKYSLTCFGLASAITLFYGTLPAGAQQPKVIGNWMITVEADRFSDAAPKAIALTTDKLGSFFAVRCLSGQLSFALSGNYKEGDIFLIKFRADKNAIVDTVARAISEKLLEIETTPAMFQQLTSAKEYAFRVTGIASADFVFQAGVGAKPALSGVSASETDLAA